MRDFTKIYTNFNFSFGNNYIVIFFSKRMKVVMIFPDPQSEKGISKYSLELVNNIREQGADISEQTFFQGKPWTLIKNLKKCMGFDVIHLQHEYNLLGFLGLPYFFVLSYFALKRKKSLAITMHTVLSQKEKFQHGKLKSFFRKLFYKLQNRWIDWSSDKIIVHAESFADILTNEYSVKKDKIIVFPHPIIENIKTISKEKAKKELGLTGNIYLMIGTMVPDHGHDIILKQANKIGKTLLVVTNPSSVNHRNSEKIKSFLEMNQNIVRKNGFEKFVRFDLGEIPYEKWWMYFSAADLILLPYRGGVGSGIFADAMAMKKPVVATNIIYFREFAKNYECIKLAPSNEDFPKVIKNSMQPKNYFKMIKGAEKYFRENGLAPISKKYVSLYSSLS